MRDNRLRLRLAVRRHTLPEVRVVFTLQLENDPTIAKFLEHVNEVIPLESDEWGLEDYVVELRDRDGQTFECMHFELVSNTLDRDEEILIRPLFTDDRKRRVLSGRHQISNDGKHLIDGVAFGRPRLRTPRDRPAVDIPPLKRRRLVYTEQDDGGQDENDDELFLLTEHGELGNESASFPEHSDVTDEDTDADFEGEEEDESDLENELSELHAESAELEKSKSVSQEQSLPNDEHGNPTILAAAKKIQLEDLDKLTALRDAFPGAPLETCEQVLLHSASNDTEAYRELRKKYSAKKSLRQMNSYKSSLANASPLSSNLDSMTQPHLKRSPSRATQSGRVSARSAKSALEFGYNDKPPTERVSSSSPFGSDSCSDLESEVARNDQWDGSSGRIAPQSQAREKRRRVPSSFGLHSSSSTSSDSDSGPEELPSKPSSATHRRRFAEAEDRLAAMEQGRNVDNDSEGESGSDVASISSSYSGDDTDDSTGSTSSNQDTSGNNEVRKQAKAITRNIASLAKSSDDSSGDPSESSSESSSDSSGDSSSDSSSDSEDDEDRHVDAPFVVDGHAQGPLPGTRTQSLANPNLRREPASQPVGSATGHAQNKPPGTGLSSTQRRNARRKKAKAMSKDDSDPMGDKLPVEDSSFTAAQSIILAKKASLLQRLEFQAEIDATVSSPGAAPPDVSSQIPALQTSLASDEDGNTPSPQRKAKLNLGAGRRMLFASLGLRQPKSRADEDKIRADLMKDVRPHSNPRLESDHGTRQSSANIEIAQPSDNTEAWREKISYSAVECCDVDVELTEPPFPFVQRWDPQQRGTGKRKRRTNTESYQVETPGPKKLKGSNSVQARGVGWDNFHGTAEEDIILNYDDVPSNTDLANDLDVEELQEPPSIPEDTTTLPELQLGNSVVGMSITWKHWALSQATNWEPQLRSVSGTIVDIDLDTGSIGIVLARRDREVEPSKEYDEEGNRVYGKFEAPDIEEEEDEDATDSERAGYKQMAFFDLIEPRILRQSATSERSRTLENTVIPDSQVSLKPREPRESSGNNRPSTPQGKRGRTGQMDSLPDVASALVASGGVMSAACSLQVAAENTAESRSSQFSPLGQTSKLMGAQDFTSEVILDSGPMDDMGTYPDAGDTLDFDNTAPIRGATAC